MKIFMNRIILTFALLAGVLTVSPAQDPSLPMAHYPLETTEFYPDIFYAKFTLVRPWDVSGNGNHGTTVGASTSTPPKPDANFVSKEFIPQGRRFLSKTGTHNAYVRIPDPYANDDPNNGFSVACWVYWDDEDVTADTRDVLLNTGYFRLEKTGKSLKLVLLISGSEQAISENSFYEDGKPGWYYCAVSVNHTGGTFYRYRYEEPYNLAESSMTGFTKSVPAGHFQKWLTESVIAGAAFTTAICHVQFYNQVLTKAQLNDRRNDVINLEKKNYTISEYPSSGSYVHYLLDNNTTESVRRRNATFQGSVAGTPDRFGESNKAVSIAVNSSVSLPDVFPAYTASKGYTISFWMKPEQGTNPATPTDGITLPFSDSDTRYSIFYGKDIAGVTRAGMQRVKDRLGVLRYTYDRLNTLKPFYLWWYDPASVRNRTDWVHVIMVQHENWQRTYVASKEQSLDCDCAKDDTDCLRACPCYYTYQGTQDLSMVTRWGIGDPVGTPEKFMDDFRVYTYPMSAFEARALHEVESNRIYTPPISGGGNAPARIVGEQQLAVYPNPTAGELTLTFASLPKYSVEVVLTDISGKVLMTDEVKPDPATGEVKLRNIRSYTRGSGLYLLKVKSGAFMEVHKIVLF